MLPALRREEVVVDLVETAAVDMEEEETDTAEEVAEEAVAMVRRNEPFAVDQYLSFFTEGGRGGGELCEGSSYQYFITVTF